MGGSEPGATRPGVRPAADRGGRARRRLRPGRRPSTTTPAGLEGSRPRSAWFLGDNDGAPRHVGPRAPAAASTASRPTGPNRNQGTESTLALLVDAATRAPPRPAWRRDRSRRDERPPRSPQRLRPDPSRVITRLFVPGQEGFDHQDSRTAAVLARILALDEARGRSESLDDVVAGFGGRHRDLLEHVPPPRRRGRRPARPRLRALRHPAAAARRDLHQRVRHRGRRAVQPQHRRPSRPDRRARRQPALRHERPSHRRGPPVLDRVPHRARSTHRGRAPSTPRRRSRPRARRAGAAGSRGVPERARAARQRRRERRLRPRRRSARGSPPRSSTRSWCGSRRNLATRRHGRADDRAHPRHRRADLRRRGSPPTRPLTERVLWPSMSAESHGMEDARFVRFTHDDGTRRLLRHLHRLRRRAHQPAAAGDHRLLHLHVLADRRRRRRQQGPGPVPPPDRAAASPRCRGRDRETNSVAFSDDLRQWDARRALPGADPGLGGAPARQLRLADRDRRRLARAHPRRRPDAHLQHRRAPPRPRRPDRRPRPAPTSRCSHPTADEQDGYVPNVVYSCGALVHAGTLVLPYGIGDAAIGIATVPDVRRSSPTSTRPTGALSSRADRRAGADLVADAAAALRPVGAVRLAADRGPRRPRPRRHAVRDRRLAAPSARLRSVVADAAGRRTPTIDPKVAECLHISRGVRARRRVRRHPQRLRLPAAHLLASRRRHRS